MTNEELEARLAHHSESLKAGLTAALKPFCDSMLESARIAEEGPTNRLRQNLVAGCYQIRLKALVEHGKEDIDPAEINVVMRFLAPDGEEILVKPGKFGPYLKKGE